MRIKANMIGFWKKKERLGIFTGSSGRRRRNPLRKSGEGWYEIYTFPVEEKSIHRS